jgi:hypothetical protein
MSKRKPQRELLDSYDFSGGVRGKYATRYAQGVKVVIKGPNSATGTHGAKADRLPKGAVKSTTGRPAQKSAESVSAAELREARELIRKLGGIERVKRLLETLNRLR